MRENLVWGIPFVVLVVLGALLTEGFWHGVGVAGLLAAANLLGFLEARVWVRRRVRQAGR